MFTLPDHKVVGGMSDAQQLALIYEVLRRGLVSGSPPAVNTSTTSATLVASTKTVAAAATAEAIGSGQVESVEISNNTGSNIFVGTASAQPRKVVNGDSWSASAPSGKKLNLAAIFVKVYVNGDIVDFVTLN